VPAKPAWYGKLDEIVRELEAFPRPFVDRAALESLLGVGRRRAQQILAPCVTDHVGSNGLADRQALTSRLRQLAAGDDGHYEQRRRQRLAGILVQLQKERLARPKLLVEAPVTVIGQDFENLPAGVHFAPGRITVDFEEPPEALEKLLALAMAISNDFACFERVTRSRR
jgi:hypothetical protein